MRRFPNPIIIAGLYCLAFGVCLTGAVFVGLFALSYHPTLVSVTANVAIVCVLFGVPAIIAIAVADLIRARGRKDAHGLLTKQPALVGGLYCLVFLALLATSVIFAVAILDYRPRMAAVGIIVIFVGILFTGPPLAIIGEGIISRGDIWSLTSSGSHHALMCQHCARCHKRLR